MKNVAGSGAVEVAFLLKGRSSPLLPARVSSTLSDVVAPLP